MAAVQAVAESRRTERTKGMSLAAGSTVIQRAPRRRPARLRIGAGQIEAWAYVLPALALFLLFNVIRSWPISGRA